jgi:hypothetical protein
MWNVLVCGTASAMLVHVEAFELTQLGVTGALTVNVAALLVAVPAALPTVTLKLVPLSVFDVAGVV